MDYTGSFVRLRWPYTDLKGGKTRPALVLSGPDDRGDLELAMISSKSTTPTALPLSDSDYASDLRLPKDSFVRSDRTLTVSAESVERLTPSVTPAFLNKVRKCLVLANTKKFSLATHAGNRPGWDPDRLAAEQSQLAAAAPGASMPVPYAGRVFTEDEVEAAVSSTLDFWLTLGPEGEAFERELAQLLGVKHSLLVNSGSSANLVALSALTSHKLPDHKRILPGDEVITVAAGFPTTVAPILQAGAVPVFIDNNPNTGNAVVDYLEAAYVPGKTKAVMMAHALGNPFDIGTILAFCKKHDLSLVEDNCDALGCSYTMPIAEAISLGLTQVVQDKETGGYRLKVESPLYQIDLEAGTLTAPTGAWGDISTQSFYPPHHLTMGEGGAVSICHRPPLKTYAESFRDWGRDCWCPSGKDNTCNKRFGWQLGELPDGYDHKYIYSHLGFNLKPLDPQAAIGRQQLKRLPAFIEARKRNWEILRAGLADLEEFFQFSLPTHATSWRPPVGGVEGASLSSSHSATSTSYDPLQLKLPTSTFTWDSTGRRTDCSWFGFMMRVRPGSPFTHSELGRHLDEHKIGNRMLFGGNLLRQPVFVQLRKDRPNAIRVVGPDGRNVEKITSESIAAAVPGADEIMNTALFLGTFPGLTDTQLAYEIETIHKYVRSF